MGNIKPLRIRDLYLCNFMNVNFFLASLGSYFEFKVRLLESKINCFSIDGSVLYAALTTDISIHKKRFYSRFTSEI